jgi:hypothetical protein
MHDVMLERYMLTERSSAKVACRERHQLRSGAGPGRATIMLMHCIPCFMPRARQNTMVNNESKYMNVNLPSVSYHRSSADHRLENEIVSESASWSFRRALDSSVEGSASVFSSRPSDPRRGDGPPASKTLGRPCGPGCGGRPRSPHDLRGPGHQHHVVEDGYRPICLRHRCLRRCCSYP